MYEIAINILIVANGFIRGRFNGDAIRASRIFVRGPATAIFADSMFVRFAYFFPSLYVLLICIFKEVIAAKIICVFDRI